MDDAAKGGDIDLYVELPQPASPLAIARMLDLVVTLERIHDRAAEYCTEKLAVSPAPTFGEKR